MRYKEITEVNINNDHGWGSTPLNREVDYFGLKVLMKPSTFLKLAAPLNSPARDSIKQHIKNQGSIGAPFLTINLPEEWDNGDFSKPAEVRSHEGRNRMHSILEIEGDNPIEVHLFFGPGVRNRHLTPAIKKELNTRLSPERRNDIVLDGPFFEINT